MQRNLNGIRNFDIILKVVVYLLLNINFAIFFLSKRTKNMCVHIGIIKKSLSVFAKIAQRCFRYTDIERKEKSPSKVCVYFRVREQPDFDTSENLFEK